MRHFLVTSLIGMLGFGLAVEHADAHRMGGGKSIGSDSRTLSSQNTSAPKFSETWHLVRELRDGAPWCVKVIEQNTAS